MTTQREPEPLDRFYWFMRERHAIFERQKNGEPRPWTKDPTLERACFTNVFRELDRVTIWIRRKWREPFPDHHNLWFAMAIARQINWPDTLAEIGFPSDGWDADRAFRIMRARAERGEKVYTSAYRPRTEPKIKTRAEYTTRIVLGDLWRDRKNIEPRLHTTIEAATKALAKYNGWGGTRFLAYETVTDLRHTRYLENAPDKMTWANTGPGANLGLNRIFGRPVKTPINERGCLEEMRLLLKAAPEFLPERFPSLEMRDIEHSLCEFSKYEAIRLGERNPKRLYVPHPDRQLPPRSVSGSFRQREEKGKGKEKAWSLI